MSCDSSKTNSASQNVHPNCSEHERENDEVGSIVDSVNSDLYDAEIENYFNTVGNADFLADCNVNQSVVLSEEENQSLLDLAKISNHPSIGLVDSVPIQSVSTSSITVGHKRQKLNNKTTFHKPTKATIEVLPNTSFLPKIARTQRLGNILSNSSSSAAVAAKPKSPYIYDPTLETRMDFLTRSPRLMQNCVNGYDFKGLKTLVNEICLENCKFKTPALPQELVGRRMIVKYWQSVLIAAPDLVIVLRLPEVNFRVISIKCLSVGTAILHGNKDDHLWNFLKYGKDDHDTDSERLKLRFNTLIEANKQICFTFKSVLHLVLNESKTHVERYISTRRSLEIDESSPQIVSKQTK